MTPAEYKALRKRLGPQHEVARRLDVHLQTVSRRERGELPVDREAELALRHLVECENGGE